MTPREVIAQAKELGLDPIQYLYDYMRDKDSRVSWRWCELMTGWIPVENTMTNYQRWCQRILMPKASSDKLLTWLLRRNAHYGDVQALDFGLYDMLLSIYTDELLAKLEMMIQEEVTK